MNRKTALSVMKSGQFFTAKFTKKNGEERTINGRVGVKKHLKGGVMPYSAKDYGIVVVHENKTNDKPGGYKAIKLDSLIELNGEKVVK